MSTAELLLLAKVYRDTTSYASQVIAAEHGHTIYFTPPHFSQVTADQWIQAYRKAQLFEDKYAAVSDDVPLACVDDISDDGGADVPLLLGEDEANDDDGQNSEIE
ncbi:unnamed protein product [Aphanomyces euteiches]